MHEDAEGGGLADHWSCRLGDDDRRLNVDAEGSRRDDDPATTPAILSGQRQRIVGTLTMPLHEHHHCSGGYYVSNAHATGLSPKLATPALCSSRGARVLRTARRGHTGLLVCRADARRRGGRRHVPDCVRPDRVGKRGPARLDCSSSIRQPGWVGIPATGRFRTAWSRPHRRILFPA